MLAATVARASDMPPDGDPEAWEIQSVRELMRRDMQRSLERGSGHTEPSSTTLETAGGWHAPRLVAMYGVGRALMAEVVVGTQAYLYMRGQAHPVGYANDPLVYQLRGMEGSCIELQRAQRSHSLCLRAMLGARRP
jgi:hypothetical protein